VGSFTRSIMGKTLVVTEGLTPRIVGRGTLLAHYPGRKRAFTGRFVEESCDRPLVGLRAFRLGQTEIWQV